MNKKIMSLLTCLFFCLSGYAMEGDLNGVELQKILLKATWIMATKKPTMTKEQLKEVVALPMSYFERKTRSGKSIAPESQSVFPMRRSKAQPAGIVVKPDPAFDEFITKLDALAGKKRVCQENKLEFVAIKKQKTSDGQPALLSDLADVAMNCKRMEEQ